MKNMHGVNIESPEECMAKIRNEIRDQLAVMENINDTDAAVDRACVELSKLHSLFARKHTIMRRMRLGALDLDCYAAREAQ